MSKYIIADKGWLFLFQPDAINMIPAQMQIPGLDMTATLHNTSTEVLCLMNMVEIEELMDDEEYEGRLRSGQHTALCWSRQGFFFRQNPPILLVVSQGFQVLRETLLIKKSISVKLNFYKFIIEIT